MAHKGNNGQPFVWFFLLLDSYGPCDYYSRWQSFTGLFAVSSQFVRTWHIWVFFFFDTTGTSGLVSHSQEHVENEFLLVEFTTR